jgi:deoxyadenosine/deoxycytidine kinase
MAQFVSIEGNIGVGKSTFVKLLLEKIKDSDVVNEPVEQWLKIKDSDGKNILGEFYEDKKRWAYTFQTCALLTRQKNMQQMIKHLSDTDKTNQIILTERSILTDRHIFAEMLHETGMLTEIEWNLYNNLFEVISQSYQVHGVIYLSTSCKTSKDRIAVRGRPEEEEISMNYLNDLHKQHEKWLSSPSLPVLTLSTEPDSSLDNNIRDIKDFVEELKRIYL